MLPRPPISTLFPYTTLFRSRQARPPRLPVPRAAHAADCGESDTERRTLNLRNQKEGTSCAKGFDIRRDYASAIRDEYRSEEHTSELQSRGHLVCRLLLEKKK